MTKPISAKQIGVKVCWKVRIVVGGQLISVISLREPSLIVAEDGTLAGVDWQPHPCKHGDWPAFVRWGDVSAVTWRKA